MEKHVVVTVKVTRVTEVGVSGSRQRDTDEVASFFVTDADLNTAIYRAVAHLNLTKDPE